MLRTITQKCPSCGYVFAEKQHIEVQTVSVEKRYTHRPVRNLNPIHGKEINQLITLQAGGNIGFKEEAGLIQPSIRNEKIL